MFLVVRTYRQVVVPEADLDEFVRDVVELVATLSRSRVGCGGGVVKDAIPSLPNRVFAYFTIIKSRESSSRLRDDDDNDRASGTRTSS